MKLYLTLSDEEEGGEVLVPYFIPGRWEEMVDDEKERAKALGRTDQEESAERVEKIRESIAG